jgi:selenocysteine-specific elongation factor
VSTLPIRLGVSPSEASRIAAESGCVVVADRAYPALALEEAISSMQEALAEAEATFPFEPGVKLESLSALAGATPALARAAISELEKRGAVVVRGALVARSDWKPALDEAQQKTVRSLVHAICSSGSEPPSLAELSAKYGSEVPGLLRYLEREGRLVQVTPDRYYARDEVNGLIEKLRENLQAGMEYGPSQLRDVLGFSRKYLIPFLEYCDRAGVTERRGDGRALRNGPVSLTQM